MPDVQAVILAGGKGTRLRPVTADLPKPLVPIANRSLIDHQLRHLAASGVRDVTLALGYQAERFRGVEEEAAELGLRLSIVVEPAPLGTGGALRWCADEGAFDEDRPLLWINGDVVASPDVATLAEFHQQRRSLVTLWLTSARDTSEFGVVELEADGFVERFLEKPGPDETSSHLVNAGILMLEPSVLWRVPPDTFFSFEKGVLPAMVREREPVYGRFDGGYWLDTGRPASYLAANRHVLEQRVPWQPRGTSTDAGLWVGADVAIDTSRLIRPAAIGDHVAVAPGAQLFGRTVLGDRCAVGLSAMLENCVLHDDVAVGRGAQVLGSVVCAGARVEPEAVVENSIVGAGAVVGRGNHLRGTRLSPAVALPDGAVTVDV